MKGMTHGQWPFWCPHMLGPQHTKGPVDWTCNARNMSDSNYRESLLRDDGAGHYEIVTHRRCNLTAWGRRDMPDCVHHWAERPDRVSIGSFIYTTAKDWCCWATTTQPTERAFVREFVRLGYNVSMVPRYTTEFYDGPILNYSIYSGGGPSGLQPKGANNFWYYTTPDGRPVEFGEGCQFTHDASRCPGRNDHAIFYWTYNASSVEVLGPGDLPATPPPLPAVCTVRNITLCPVGLFNNTNGSNMPPPPSWR